MVGVGSTDASDYHALEAFQCMIERRRGGETGVNAVQILDGEDVWKAGEDGMWSIELLEAALSRSDGLKGRTDVDARTQDLAHNGELRKLVEKPALYLIDYNDGLRATLLMLNGAVTDCTFAARVKGFRRIQSTQFYIGPKDNVTYSACLVANAEHMIETGQSPFPIERNQIVCGILDRCLDSRRQNNARLETPELNIRYKVPDTAPFIDTMVRSI